MLPGRCAADEAEDPDISEVGLMLDSEDSTTCGVVTLHGALADPLLWSDESPSLYVMIISLHHTLHDAEYGSDAIDVESCRVGIRDVRCIGEHNVLGVNSRPLVIAGVNRHEFDPLHGRCVSLETMRKDVMILKQLNFNAVRMSHYPQHVAFMELCDEAGLYVVDEANIESHGFQLLGQSVAWPSFQVIQHHPAPSVYILRVHPP